jgi:hypothetical protein
MKELIKDFSINSGKECGRIGRRLQRKYASGLPHRKYRNCIGGLRITRPGRGDSANWNDLNEGETRNDKN